MISNLNSFRYVELDGEFIEMPFQHFEEVSPEVAVAKTMVEVPFVPNHVPRMASLKWYLLKKSYEARIRPDNSLIPSKLL